MVHCAAIDCTNSLSKESDDRLSFFKLPRDPNRKKIWISKLKRKHLMKEGNLFVYHHHFKDSCFQRDLRVRILSDFFIFTCLCQIVILNPKRVVYKDASDCPTSNDDNIFGQTL